MCDELYVDRKLGVRAGNAVTPELSTLKYNSQVTTKHMQKEKLDINV